MNLVHLQKDKATSTIHYSDKTNYEDLRFPFTSTRIDVSGGRINYNYTENTVDFGITARYPEEPISFIIQMPHSKELNTVVYPHLHWVQEENNIPNWLIAYRWYNNGQLVPGAFTLAKYITQKYTYVTGALLQIIIFPTIIFPINEKLSSILDIRLYRDSTNVSTLFAGADPYTIAVKAKELDIHYLKGTVGSGEEYYK